MYLLSYNLPLYGAVEVEYVRRVIKSVPTNMVSIVNFKSNVDTKEILKPTKFKLVKRGFYMDLSGYFSLNFIWQKHLLNCVQIFF